MKSLAFGVALTLISMGASAADTMPVLDPDFTCIDQTKADQYVRDFRINVRSFGGNELCRPEVDTKKLFNDLGLIEQGRFGAAVPNNLIRGFLPADQYYPWMKSQTRGIDRGQDVPYATAYNSGGYFTMQDGWAELSTLGRVGTVIHEARHTQGYYHISCQQGPYLGSGVSGCDRDYQYGGSHAIEMEYYARVSVSGLNFHPVYKKMARLMAMGRSNFVFNQTPLRSREGLVMITRTGRVYLQDQGGWTEREAPSAPGFALKRTSFGAVLFDGTRAFVLDPYENSGFNWSVDDDFSYFKLLKSDRGLGGGRIRELEELDIGRKRHLVALSDQGQISSFNFRGGSWNRPVAAPAGTQRFATWSPSGETGLFLIDSSNRVHAADPERLGQTRPTGETWDPGIRQFVRSSTGFYRLTTAGELQRITAGQVQPVETPEAVDQIVAVPLYDSFEVKP